MADLTPHYVESVRILSRYVQHELGFSVEKQAELTGQSRDWLNRFLRQQSKRNPEGDAKQIAAGLESIVRGHLNKVTGPSAVSIVEAVYGEDFVGLARSGGSRAASIFSKDLVRNIQLPFLESEARKSQDLPNLFGLAALIRISNEFLPTGGGNYRQGYSLSILNLVPPHIDRGLHHSLFKLRQNGKQANNQVDTEGYVVAQDDRILLVGREISALKAMFASIPWSDETCRRFRDADNEETAGAPLSGLLMGVNNSKANFLGMFLLAYIPGSYLEEVALKDDQARKEFTELYNRVRDLAGVSLEDELLVKLLDMGIDLPENVLDELQQNSQDQLVFSVN